MKNLIKNIFKRGPVNPPQSVIKGFTDAFHHSINIEWSKTRTYYEALFYENEIEKIARFDIKGNLIEIRKNILTVSLPEKINQIAIKHGELMNAIIIDRDHRIFYEIIVMKNALKRYLLLVNQEGTVLKNKKL